MKRWSWLLAACPALAWADAVDVSLMPRAQVGKGLPSISIQIREPIAGFELKLHRSDGKDVLVRGGGRPGQTRTIDLTQPEGTFKYSGTLGINLPRGETASMPLEFEASLLGPLRIKVAPQDVDVPGRKLKFTLNRVATRAHLRVLMDTGQLAIDADIPLASAQADAPVELEWPEKQGRVLAIEVKAYDAESFFDGVELSPWQVDIPHEEVNFDSGKWDIRKDQEARLQQSYQLISDAVEKYGRLADIKLYIAGHTDTVGSNADNRVLSLNRARSIGAYFRRAGLRIAIFYEGFGEEALLVATPDNTDEARNRRAEYIIAAQTPTVAHAPFAPNWRKL